MQIAALTVAAGTDDERRERKRRDDVCV